MRLQTAIKLFAFAVFVGGCSRRYDANYRFDKTNVIGTWVLQSAPPAAVQVLGTNGHFSRLILKGDGHAEYHLLPLQTVIDLSLVRSTPSQWRLYSGTNIWLFFPQHYGKQTTWAVMLETDDMGSEFDVRRLMTGGDILIYKKDAKSDDEPVIFRRAKEGELKQEKEGEAEQ